MQNVNLPSMWGYFSWWHIAGIKKGTWVLASKVPVKQEY